MGPKYVTMAEMKSKTHQFYDTYAKQWADYKTNSFFYEKQFRLFEKLLKKGDSVLDIGCAYGIHAPLFLGIGRKLKYFGIDLSSEMVKLAKSRYPQMQFKTADVIKFKSAKKFDSFWSAATLMHVPKENWDKMLSNIEANMKPGAIGFISLVEKRPNPASKTDQRHFELFTQSSFKELVVERGWKVLKSGTHRPKKVPNPSNLHWFIVKI